MIRIFVVLFCFLGLGVNCFNNTTKFNSRPIIGIYTAPSTQAKFPSFNYSYVAASYVKFVESRGAQVAPIPQDATYDYLDTLFSKINGILFPGGRLMIKTYNVQQLQSIEFTFQDSAHQIFTRNANYLIQKANKATNKGDFFPIWGTCQGLQLIHYIESGFNSTVLKTGFNDKASRVTKKIDNTSKLFEKKCLNFQKTTWKILLMILLLWVILILKESLQLATFESINYPIFGTQFHPEKNAFEWKADPTRHFESTLVSQYFANFFVQQAKQNVHSFNGTNDENKYLIYQYPTYSFPASSYTEIYIIKNFGNPEVDFTQAFISKGQNSNPLNEKLILENQFEDGGGL
ncbi:hypothetical protein ABPG72_000592 [Tetrahymena utriculariae]